MAQALTDGEAFTVIGGGDTGMEDADLVGIVDITDICSALLDLSEAAHEPLSDP